MHHVIVLLICGVPGCGKSTLVKAIAEAHRSNKNERVTILDHIEYDQIYHEILLNNENNTNGNSKKEMDSSFVHAFANDDELSLEGRIKWQKSRVVAFQRVQQWLSSDRNDDLNATTRILLLDDNFYLKSMRKNVYRICSDYVEQQDSSMVHQLYFGTIYLHAPLSVCLERNAQRPAPIATGTIERMVQRFEVPAHDRNFWEAAVLSMSTLSGLPDQVRQVQQFLATIVENPAARVVPRAEELETPPSIITVRQQADLFWRRCVGWVAQHARAKVPLANRVRKHCLQQPLGDMRQSWWLLFVQGLPEERHWLTREEQRFMEQELLTEEHSISST